jgi:hypothetical protein
MIHAHIAKEKTVPMWAALGVPLIGIPLTVALLELTYPEHSYSLSWTRSVFRMPRPTLRFR